MPIYEYSCHKCGATVEVMQKITDEPLKRHAKCGGKLEKQLSAPALQFKGSGWYVTDYAGRKSEGKEEGKAEKKAEAGDAKGGEPPAGDGASKGAESKKTAAKPTPKKSASGD